MDFGFFVAIVGIVFVATVDMVLVGTAADWEDNMEVDSILFLLFTVDALV